MSQKNVELLAECYSAFNGRDWDAFVSLVDADAVVESRLVAVEGGYRGHAGVRRWWDDFFGAFPDYKVDVEELRDFGDVTLAQACGRAHGAGSDTPLIDRNWTIVRWRDGKAVWWRNCASEAEALEAAGLSDQPLKNA